MSDDATQGVRKVAQVALWVILGTCLLGVAWGALLAASWAARGPLPLGVLLGG